MFSTSYSITGSQRTRKTLKNDVTFLVLGNIVDFKKNCKILWKNQKKPGKKRISVIINTYLSVTTSLLNSCAPGGFHSLDRNYFLEVWDDFSH